MTRRRPQVISPLERLFEREGVEIVLVAVELWADEVVVRLKALPSARTQQLEQDFEAALEEWGRRRAGSGEPPPGQPADRIFDVEIELSDDAGTGYRPRSSARGGTGSLFHADWFFAPGAPEEATVLAVRVDEARLELALE